MKKLLINFLGFFKRFISPVLVSVFGQACRYTPTCSEYAKEAIQKHGVASGLFIATKRIIRCSPLFRGGPDPVPPKNYS